MSCTDPQGNVQAGQVTAFCPYSATLNAKVVTCYSPLPSSLFSSLLPYPVWYTSIISMDYNAPSDAVLGCNEMVVTVNILNILVLMGFQYKYRETPLRE